MKVFIKPNPNLDRYQNVASTLTTMLVGEYSLRLQKGNIVSHYIFFFLTNNRFTIIGIQGGFAPPTPNAIHIITQPLNKDELLITSAIRKEGTPGPGLQDAAPKFINSKDEHTASLVNELYGILKKLPTENPPGSQDIYGLDTSIAWLSEDLQWINGSPEGCGGGSSSVQPSEDEKAKFKRAVDIVDELVKKDK